MAKTAEQILAELDNVLLRPATGSNPTIPANYGDFVYSFNPKRTGGSNASPGVDGGKPLWQNALGSLGGVGSAVTNTVYENMNRANKQIGRWGDGKFNWKDDVWKSFGTLGNSIYQPVEDAVVNPAKYQWDHWTNGERGFDYNDIPGLGTLNLMNERNKHGSDILGLTGVKNEAVKKWGGLGLDILLDPVTYLTFGAGSAIKAGAKAVGTTAAEQASKAGVKAVTKGKDVDKIAGNTAVDIMESTRDRLVKQGINPVLAERFAIQSGMKSRDAIMKAGGTARAGAQNALINLDIPFTKITKQFGKKPGFLTKAPEKVGQAGSVTVAETLARLGAHTDDTRRALLSKMGIDVPTLEDINIQQFAHLQDQASMAGDFTRRYLGNDGKLKNNLRNFRTADEVVGKNEFVDYQPFKAEDILSQLDPRIADRIAPFIQGLSGNVDQLRQVGPEALRTFGGALGKMPGTIKGNAADSLRTGMDQAADLTADATSRATIRTEPITAPRIAGEIPSTASRLPREFDEFAPDMGGRSAFGDKLGGITDLFNSRTLGVQGEGVVNNSAEAMRKAEGAMYAGTRNLDKMMQGLPKDLSIEEQKSVEYLLENAFKDGVDPANVTPRAKEVADKLRKAYQQAGSEESRRGILQSLEANYAPHALRPDVDELVTRAGNYTDDEAFTKLVSKSSGSQFAKDRKSFQSFAELDNVLGKMWNTYGKMADPAKAAVLKDKIEILENLFERNPIDAFAKRMYKSIKSRAMKDLQDSLRKDGLLRDSISKSPEVSRIAKQFHRLSKSEAAVLNLKSGSYIHKDVFEGLKKIEDVFTVKGMNKWVKVWDDFQNVWKSLVTANIPSHYLNNAIGNVFNNMLAGVGVQSYTRAGKLLNKVRQGKTLTRDEEKLYQNAMENGVMHQGWQSDFVQTAGQIDGKIAKFANFVYRKSPVAAPLRKYVGDPTENFTRMALFIHGMKNTGSTKHAADLVKKHLFNYHEMTSADKVVRRVVPFWNFMKNNVPLQLQKLMQQPRIYENYDRIKDANQEGTEMPDYRRESSFVMPDGKHTWDPRLPLNDLNGILGGGAFDIFRYGASALSPFIKAPLIEVPTNKNVYTGRTIDYDREYQGQADPATWARYGLSQLGAINKVGNFFDGEGDFITDLRNMFTGSVGTLKQ